MFELVSKIKTKYDIIEICDLMEVNYRQRIS